MLDMMKNSMIVPMVRFDEFKNIIETWNESSIGEFSIKMSIHGGSYIMRYHNSMELVSSAELPYWHDGERRKNFIILYPKHFHGNTEAFDSLFKVILGKMIGKEILPLQEYNIQT